MTDQDTLYKVIQDSIQYAIETAALKSVDVKSLREQMSNLCHKSFDVPTVLTDWAEQQVEKVCSKSVHKCEDPKPCHPLSSNEKPLFTKDTLYHASLCCQAVSTCTVAVFKKFFNGKGHNLKEVSMSISQNRENVDRYIIAKQGNIVYIAFQSEPSLSEWKGHKSFTEGN